MEFRLLKANEIDCRIATVKAPTKDNKGGLSLLLYKDARVDQNLLDETVGSMNWQRSQEVIDGSLYCTVSIWDDEKKQWVSKQDVGTESYTEKEKGKCSDAYKRACFNWGIGRELYTAPFIWVSGTDCNISNDGKCYDKFEVTDIGYNDNREINALTIINTKTKAEVFRMGGKPKKTSVQEEKQSDFATEEQIRKLKGQMKTDNVSADFILNAYKIKDFKSFTSEMYENVMKNWSKVVAAAHKG